VHDEWSIDPFRQSLVPQREKIIAVAVRNKTVFPQTHWPAYSCSCAASHFISRDRSMYGMLAFLTSGRVFVAMF